MAKQADSQKKTMAEKISALNAKRAKLELGGGQERIEKQHASGKLTARERVARLVAVSYTHLDVYKRQGQ